MYDLGMVNIWNYYGGTRSYHDIILQLSEDGSAWTTVFNNDTNNSAKQGVGTDAEYTETAEGKSIVLPSPIKARYIRAWVNGSTANTGNHFAYSHSCSDTNTRTYAHGDSNTGADSHILSTHSNSSRDIQTIHSSHLP